MIIKPMLAATVTDLSAIRYPVYASFKIDGVRCLGVNGVAQSRSGKSLPNRSLQALFAGGDYDGLDGELVVGDPYAKDVFRRTTSVVMSHDKPIDDLRFMLFDRHDMSGRAWHSRYGSLREPGHIGVGVPHIIIRCEAELLAYEEEALAVGAEGVMLRDPLGSYKNGRSTEKQGGLLKLKRFVDEEFEVVGFEERMHNANVAFTNELGRTARSTHQENMVGTDTLGALICKTSDGLTFGVGTGFDDAQRAEIWANRDAYLGRLATVKHFPIGVKDLPRLPVFKGFRSTIDL
jgi:DNA ligase-1